MGQLKTYLQSNGATDPRDGNYRLISSYVKQFNSYAINTPIVSQNKVETSFSANGLVCTVITKDANGNTLDTNIRAYLDNQQATLIIDKYIKYALGTTTTTTVNYNPTYLNGSCTATTQTYQKFDDGSSMTTTVNPGSSKVIESVSADGKVKTVGADSNGDTIIDDVKTTTTLANGITVTKDDVGNNKTIASEYVSYIGQQYSLSDKTQTIAADIILSKLFSQGAISSSDYLGFSYDASAALTSFGLNPSSNSGFGLNPALPTPLSQDPIGAFYEAKSAALDKALSIANQTGVLIGSNNKGMTTTTLQALDANKDGKLSGAELACLQVWTDSNENGTLDAGELKTLVAAGINQIASTDYSFYTKGNSVWANSQSATPTQINLVQGLPASNYRSLRDSDNRYWVNSYQWIDFGANQESYRQQA